YPEDDTVLIPRRTNYVNGTGIVSGKSSMFTLSQNIPNPANSSTRINYGIPEAGTVVFHVHSVSGQLLYSKTIETPSGKQSLELNTSTFAAGIYFYSIEYKGQRIVKRMMISD
ncbi:MAG: T9SS type A sorting domain-containing protein, partial [Bacteroidales bacterium]|nr:T9SS type A sorting domain-containing protein [Bacteroidales bacterium]